MPKLRLTTVTRRQRANAALLDGEVTLPDAVLDFQDVTPLPRAFSRMVREDAYDVSEMALTTFFCAKAHGADMVGLPIFLQRDFLHGTIVGRAGELPDPGDLQGRTIGVARGYTVTPGVWARAILTGEYGLDPTSVTWQRSGDEHVGAWNLPPNVGDLDPALSLADHLSAGHIDAAIGLPPEPGRFSPLIPDTFEAARRAFLSRGFYPISHLIVLKGATHAAHPGLARQVFDAYAAAKRIAVADLAAGRVTDPGGFDKVHLAVMERWDDPLPYGLAPNLAMLKVAMQACVTQGILAEPLPLEALFAADLLDMTG